MSQQISSNSGLRKFLLASSLGTFLELLDFILYASASTIIALNFFPANDELALLKTLGIFAMGFLARPFGAIAFGYVGDKYGCRRALIISMVLMATATCGVGLLPTYQQCGMIAPVLLIILRLLQGLAVSPEYNGASTYLKLYHSDSKHYNLMCSLTPFSAGFGIITGCGVIALITNGYTIETLPEWRWRLPFILSGIIVGIASIWLRLSMLKGRPTKQVKMPIINAIKTQKSQIAIAILMAGFISTMTYFLFVFVSTFLQDVRGFSINEVTDLIWRCTLFTNFMCLVSGYMVDKFGRIKILTIAITYILITGFVSYYFIVHGAKFEIMCAIILFDLGVAFFGGILPAMMADMFHEQQRYSSSSLSYNIGVTWLGANTPLIMMSLIKFDVMLPGIIISLFSLIVFIVIKLYASKMTDPANNLR